MNKRIMILLVILILAAILVGCNIDNGQNNNTSPTLTQGQQSTQSGAQDENEGGNLYTSGSGLGYPY